MTSWKYSETTRLAKEGKSFTVEEKFDTWLDLSPLIHLKQCVSTFSNTPLREVPGIDEHLSRDVLSECEVLEIDTDIINESRVTPLAVSHVIHEIMCSTPQISNKFRRSVLKNVSHIQGAVTLAAHIQLNHLTDHMSDSIKGLLSGNQGKWESKIASLPREIYHCLHHASMWTTIMAHYRKIFSFSSQKGYLDRARGRLEAGHLEPVSIIPGWGIKLTHSIVILSHKSYTFLIDADMLKEIYNKVHELLCLLLYTHNQSGTSMPDNSYTLLCDWVKYLCNYCVKFLKNSAKVSSLTYQNRPYKFLKMVEGFGVSELIRRNDTELGWPNTDLCSSLWAAVVEDRLDPAMSWQTSELWRLLNQMTSAQIAEYMGVVKICGHPSIEVEEGLQKLYERTHTVLNIDPQSIIDSIATLTRELFRNFYRKYKKYPNFSLHPENCCNQLRQLTSRNLDPCSDRGALVWSRINKMSWSHIKLEKTEEFDPVDCQLPLLKDKSMGIVRSKVLQQVLHNPSAKKRCIGEVTERRALLKFLLTPYFDVTFQNYLAQYQDDDSWPDCVWDYLVIKLTPKELELKSEGRMFGASPLEERNRRIVQEMNVMRFMDSYCPDQLMTPNELLMIKKLYSFRLLHKMYPDSYVLQVSFDFSKWNNNMRHQSIDIPAARILDRWFGVNIYNKTMRMYENALIYYADGNKQRFWEGQLGGIEGLNQATWSYVFLGGIKNALEELGLVYQLTVKGDDVRAAIVVPKKTLREGEAIKVSIERTRNHILRALEQLCQQMGWELKPEESFVSLSLVATSKQYQVNDTWLPSSCKKMMKCMSLSELMFPTLEDIISNIFSTAHSACSQTTVAMPAYLTALFTALWTLNCEYARYDLSVAELVVLILWPQVLSGPGGLPLQTFFVRGENDMLAISISLCRHMILNDYAEVSQLIRRVLGHLSLDNHDKSLLVSDPYSIPIAAPVRPSSVLRGMLKDALRKWVKNTDIKVLLSHKSLSDRRAFLDTLLSMTPYYGKLATMIWECTPFYLIDEILSKFMQSSTVVAFLSHGRTKYSGSRLAHRALDKVVLAGEKRLLFWFNSLRTYPTASELLLGVDEALWLTSAICSTEITHQIRQLAWGMVIFGVTYPSLVDQSYISQLSDITCHASPRLIEEGLTRIHINKKALRFQTDDKSHHYSSNEKNIPWLGSTTSTKIRFLDGPIDVKSSTISKISKMITLLRLADYYGPGFKTLIKNVIKGLTDVRVTDLVVLTPEIPFGHIGHRGVMNSFSLSTMPNYRPNLSQLIDINNEGLLMIRNDNSNRTINFAARNFMLIVWALFPLQFNMLLPTDWPEHLVAFFHHDIRVPAPDYDLCPFCCNVIDDVEVNICIVDMPDLDEYHDLPIVGTSEYEKIALVGAIKKNVVGKSKRHLEHLGLDAENPINIVKATQLVVSNLLKESSHLHYEMMQAHFTHIPKGALLDTMAVSLGFKSLMSSQLSLNVIRAIPPSILYQTITFECFFFIVKTFTSEHEQLAIAQLQLMQNHLNPLSNMFAQLIHAGVLHKIVHGANEVQFLSQKLTWTAACVKDGHVAAKHFVKAHTSLYEYWMLGAQQPPSPMPFTRLQNDDNILDVLEHSYLVLMKILCYSMSQWTGIGNCSSYLKGLFNWSRKHDTTLRNGIEIIGCKTKDQHEQTWRYIFTKQMGIEPPHLENKYMGWMAEIFLCLELPYWVSRGEWNDGPLEELIATLRTFNVYELSADIPYLPQELTEEQVESQELYQWCWKYMSSTDICVLWDIRSDYVSHAEFGEVFLTLMDACYRDTTTSLGWMNHVVINVMTEEDAERVLRRQGLTLHSYLENYELAPALEQVDALNINDDLARCGLRRSHPQDQLEREVAWFPNTDYLIDEYQGNDNWNLLNAFYAGVQLPKIAYQCQTLRCVGGMNAAVAKWIYAWSLLRLNQILSPQHTQGTLVNIGDGSGGVTRFLLMLYSHMKGIICTKAYSDDLGNLQTDYDISTAPIELSNNTDDPTLINRVDHTTCFPGDISMTAVRDLLITKISQSDTSVIFFTCDIDKPHNMTSDQYVTILWDIMSVVAHFYHQEPYLLFKVKLVPGFPLINWLTYIYHQFTHVHFFWNQVSTLHDKEMFVFASHPQSHIEDIPRLTLGKSARANYFPSHGFRQHLASTITDIKCVYAQEITAMYLHHTPLHSTLQMFSRMEARIRQPDDILMAHDIHCGSFGDHYCTYVITLETAFQKQLHALWLAHNRAYPDPDKWRRTQVGRLPLTTFGITVGPNSKTVAAGVSSLVALVQKILGMSFISATLRELCDETKDRVHVFSKGVDNVLISLNQLLSRHGKYFHIMYRGLTVLIIIKQVTIDLNQVILENIKWVDRMIGHLGMHAIYIARDHQLPIINRSKSIQHWVCDRCCVDAAHEMMNVIRRPHNLPHNIPVLLDARCSLVRSKVTPQIDIDNMPQDFPFAYRNQADTYPYSLDVYQYLHKKAPVNDLDAASVWQDITGFVASVGEIQGADVMEVVSDEDG